MTIVNFHLLSNRLFLQNVTVRVVDNSQMLKLRQREVNILSKDIQLIKAEPAHYIYIFLTLKSYPLIHIASTKSVHLTVPHFPYL